jgi:hypothetical protein
MDGVRAIKPVVAVFGATGYTGRFVLRELLRRDIRMFYQRGISKFMPAMSNAVRKPSEAEAPENY